MTASEWLAALVGGSAVIGAGVYLLGGGTIVSKTKKCSSEAFRAAMIAAARSQLGTRDLDKYAASAAPQFVGEKPEWCGIFALWAMHEAGIARDVTWTTGLGFLYKGAKKTNDPQPGDIAYYDKPWQHHAVIESIDGDNVHLLNGNGSGNVVTATTAPRAKATAYYSIQPWVDAAVKGCES